MGITIRPLPCQAAIDMTWDQHSCQNLCKIKLKMKVMDALVAGFGSCPARTIHGGALSLATVFIVNRYYELI